MILALQIAIALTGIVFAWGFVSLVVRGDLFTTSSRIAPGAAFAAGGAGERPGGRRSPFLGRSPMDAITGRAGRPLLGGGA